ncbi:MAG: GerW family sporulation protein [Oscillospiraceae bacterium]|nr:GerW family sporulation protein [Oscillospiraceae bacterium]MBR7150001.1 GerW family sporulation protein [Oscillospiraceae bacterium]
MENTPKKAPLSELMETTMNKIHEMVDSNAIIGEPINTMDGVTLIPISRVSFGFGTGGTDYGKTTEKFGGGGGAGVKIDPVAFLIVKDGQTRMMPVAVPAVATVDRVLEMTPQFLDRIDGFISKKKETKDIF